VKRLITFDLLETAFGAFSMERWNDHPRPLGLYEMDKQGHKAVVALLLARQTGLDDLPGLARGLVFEFLKRAVLTDLKPPVYYRLTQTGGDRMARWVLDKWRDHLEAVSPKLMHLFEIHLTRGPREDMQRVLEGANSVATAWELSLIEPLARGIYGFDRTKREVMDRLEAHRDLPLVREFLFKLAGARSHPLCNFVDLVAQLRFQKRWTRVQRIPNTSVLGHMFFVGFLSFLMSAMCDLNTNRWGWNFFGGLMHDLPEALTRDVISPLKREMGLQDLLQELESQMMEREVYPLLEDHAPLIRFLVESPFSLKAFHQGRPVLDLSVRREAEMELMSSPVVDGPLVDLSDKYSAFLEARFSIHYGVSSRVLREAAEAIRSNCQIKAYNGIEMRGLFQVFDQI